jgi:hypothetical protein
MGHHAPLAAAAHDVAQRVEDFTQRTAPLGRIFFHQQQAGLAKLPLCIADVTGIGGSWLVARRFHPKLIAWNLTGAQLFLKLITGSSGLLPEVERIINVIPVSLGC